MRYALRSDTVPRAASGLCVCGCLRPSCGLDDELVSLTCRITLGLSALEFIEHRHKRCRFDTTYHYLIRRPVGQPQSPMSMSIVNRSAIDTSATICRGDNLNVHCQSAADSQWTMRCHRVDQWATTQWAPVCNGQWTFGVRNGH